MALQINFQKVFGVPVSPDSISTGTASLVSYPSITGSFIVTVNLNLKTYTFDLKGIPDSLANTIIDTCNTNAESLALGQIDLTNPTGAGLFLYRNSQCLPFSYQDGGTLQVGSSSNNYTSFQVTCLTNITVASI
jgi:hypothetical protein